MNSRIIFCFFVLSAFACAGGEDFGPERETWDPAIGPAPGGDPCLTSTADAQRTMGPNVQRVTASSANASYATRSGCNKFIVDIVVPFNSSPPSDGGNTNAINFESGILDLDVESFSEWSCGAFRGDVWTYVAPSFPLSGSSTPLGQYFPVRGVWESGGCHLEVQGGAGECFDECFVDQISPPASGTRTHRLLLSTRANFAYQRVRAIAHHPLELY